MPSVISPQSVILAAAMAVSGAVVFLSLYRQKTSPTNPLPGTPHLHSSKQPLRSCLSSVGKRDERDRKTKKKKKRVQFSDDVMATRRKTENFKRERKSMRIDKSCRTEIRGMPANRVALYNGILRDRIHRIECSK
ncbi:hypothetical protein Nepgr_024039 [Nepenthes gracilis]|uniref:Uncharacterized protein n=1 Tax=Nepenthes gracilis TaxID=150966 RepID=A0AAD3T3Z0_NEPGR|nr:hypothetical protein Nepgr_024039 [Nepenthes gracilis]